MEKMNIMIRIRRAEIIFIGKRISANVMIDILKKRKKEKNNIHQ